MKKLYIMVLTAAASLVQASAVTPAEIVALMPATHAPTSMSTTISAPSQRPFEACRPAAGQLKAPAGSAVAHRWEALGQAKYTDDILTGLFSAFTPQTYMVDVERDADNEGFYRIVNPFAGHPYATLIAGYMLPGSRYITIDARDPQNVIIEPSDIGIDDDGEEIYLYSYSWLAAKGDLPQSVIDAYGMRGTLTDGTIAFTGAESLWLTTATLDPAEQGYPANTSGSWKLALPGAKDYSLELLGGSWCAYEGQAIVSAWAGADVATILAGPVTDLSDEKQLADMLANPAVLVPKQGAAIEIPAGVAPNQPVYIVAVGLSADQKVQSVAVNMVYAEDKSTDWKTLPAPAEFKDYIVAHAYRLESSPGQVTVQESTTTPGRYRLVNPYASTAHNLISAAAHSAHDHYLYIDASDPDCVVLEEGPIGYITETDGDSRVSSRAAQALAAGSTKAEVKEMGFGGKFDGARISWPFEAYIYMGFLVEGPDYWMNVNFTQTAGGYSAGPMYIDLSKALGVDDAIADSDSPAEYFNLQGVRVDNPAKGQIVIMRRGTEARKIVF